MLLQPPDTRKGSHERSLGVVLVLSFILALWLVRPSRLRLKLDPSRQVALPAGHRKAVGRRWAGLVTGVVVASTSAVGPLGLGLMLSPTVFGLCVIGGVVVAELTTMPRFEGVRTAALETRTVGDYLPARLGGLVTGSTIGLGALLATTTLMGSADHMGLAGRSLSRSCSPVYSAVTGPWPGLF